MKSLAPRETLPQSQAAPKSRWARRGTARRSSGLSDSMRCHQDKELALPSPLCSNNRACKSCMLSRRTHPDIAQGDKGRTVRCQGCHYMNPEDIERAH